MPQLIMSKTSVRTLMALENQSPGMMHTVGPASIRAPSSIKLPPELLRRSFPPPLQLIELLLPGLPVYIHPCPSVTIPLTYISPPSSDFRVSLLSAHNVDYLVPTPFETPHRIFPTIPLGHGNLDSVAAP
jgi:hypothetical protein